MYKYEMHAHTNAVSRCGLSTPEEMVTAYANAGYAGIVFTDHFIHGHTAVSKDLPWNERMLAYFTPYENAKALGKKLGISVFIGIEHAYGNGKEVLVYGDLTADAFIKKPEVATMDIYEFLDFCHQNGWFVVHAHPFRVRDYINLSIPPVTKGVDGIEVYNHCNKPDENAKALELCDQTGLIKVSGSDTHSDTLCGNAGLAFDKKITTPKALVKALKSGKGRLIINGEIL